MIKIRKIDRKTDFARCNNLENNEQFVPIKLSDYLENSMVDLVYVHLECVKTIMEWVQQSKRLFPVPEVGGFLLGCYTKNSEGKYTVALEKFIPSKEVAYNSPTILEFGAKALMDLDEEMDRLPQLKLVGWFHTHPGLTPFLSVTDMTLHNGFFKKPYQLALVLDCLTKELDTGFFSRKSNGEPNNKSDFSKWIKWENLINKV